MKYQQPYGVSDSNAPYINGNPAIGQQGSIPPAAAFEYPQREIVSLILSGGFVPDDGDLQQLLQATRSQLINYCADVGVANQLGAGFTPPITSYTLGMPFRVRVAATNTAPSSFDAGAGRHPIRHVDGSDVAAGDLPAGGVVELIWDGTNFQMTNFFGRGGTGGGANNYYIKIPYVADTGTVPGAIIAPFSPAITAVSAGDLIEVKVGPAWTGGVTGVPGPTTIIVNALSSAQVLNRFGGVLRPYDIVVNEIVLLVWTGTAWQLIAKEPRTRIEIYDTPGTSYVWTCPAGVFLIDVQVWGAGAGGYNTTQGPIAGVSPAGNNGPGGCSGGYTRKFNLPVVPGNTYPIFVGAGGARKSGEGGNNGTLSKFGTSLLTATGGFWTSDSWNGAGVGSGGDINTNGGLGFMTTVLTGVYGWNAVYGFGGNAPYGGVGGGPDGFPAGQQPGGGGGGGGYYGVVGSYQSGQGGNGMVIIRY